MKGNRLHHAFMLCIFTIAFLTFFSFLPPLRIGGYQLRKIDLLADVRKNSSDPTSDAPQTQDTIQRVIDSISKHAQRIRPPGPIGMEDYSPDKSGLANFFKALANTTSGNSVRIAVFGDSFIEGDVFCGNLRDTLQRLFGGEGVGFVPITSEVTTFRRTIKHSFHGFTTYSLINKKDTTKAYEIGPAGFCFLPQEGNWVEYKGAPQNRLRKFPSLKLYYKSDGKTNLTLTVDDSTLLPHLLRPSEGNLREWKYEASPFSSVRFSVDNPDSIALFGACFEGDTGVTVDNFSLRGNSGIVLGNISDKMLVQFNKYRDYKLIVLQYGLNVVREDSLTYSWYASRMIRVINKLKRVFPETSFILMSVSDRSTKSSGKFETMKAIPAMRNAQRYIAEKTGIVFWDLYQAMGGENSMVRYVNAKPALAAKDYTHLTFKGGRKLAVYFVNSLLMEKHKYVAQ